LRSTEENMDTRTIKPSLVAATSLIALVACSVILAADAPPAAPTHAPAPKSAPGPEYAKLGYFVGKWTGEAEMKPNPFAPGGKITSTDSCEWFEGKYAVVCHQGGKSPMGPTKGLGIMSYSPEERVYTLYGVDNTGMVSTTVAKGTLTGDTWVYTDEQKMGGKLIKSRYTIKMVPPDAYHFTWEMMGEDGKWTAIVDGRNVRAK
jgi:hypothetical protein